MAPAPNQQEAGTRRIDVSLVPMFVAELFSSGRTLPVVAITTSASTGAPHVDADQVAQLLGDKARVVLLETGETTWALSSAMPEKLDVYGGALRIWWPGLQRTDNPYAHPLLFARNREDGEQRLRRILREILPPEPAPEDPWLRVGAAYHVGDVVWGLVQGLKPFGAFVELLPGVVGLVHKSEIDWTYVEDPGAFVTQGEQVKVQILRLDPVAKQAELSVKRAWNREPRAPLAAGPGGGPLLTDAPAPVPEREERNGADASAVDELQAELETLRDDRSELLRRLRNMQKDLRSATDRIAYLERQDGAAPLSSEPAFLQGVRTAYARLFSEDERHDFPLRRMRVGPAFLERLRTLDGVTTEKVLEVCAQVASGRAQEISAREVHRLRGGERGAGHVVRTRDAAAAWRCSLQDHTPGARRLHWWALPGPGGGTIEFASVGHHDDYSMPE